jgi:hypothetical protein
LHRKEMKNETSICRKVTEKMSKDDATGR